MPRPHRLQVEGGIYHVTAHGVTGRTLFQDGRDFNQFLATFARVVAERDWSCRSYCLLNTHYHLLLQTPHGDIAAGMQFLNARYAEWANYSRGQKGHLFRARYHTAFVTSNKHLIEIHRYIALNPVRASLCERAEHWRWSSYRQILGLEPPRAFVDVRRALSDFARTPAAGRARLRAFVEDVAEMSKRDTGERAA
jgi:REP element-mobilizing transposase RayT